MVGATSAFGAKEAAVATESPAGTSNVFPVGAGKLLTCADDQYTVPTDPAGPIPMCERSRGKSTDRAPALLTVKVASAATALAPRGSTETIPVPATVPATPPRASRR